MTASHPVRTAMVLAAGLGQRMRPLTARTPKPLVPFAGRPLIDHVLDRLVAAGIEKAVVNVHYLADQIERHLADRTDIAIAICDERDQLLDTGGGVKAALPHLGAGPFLVIASDTVWTEGPVDNLARLCAGFKAETMDMRLLVAATSTSIGVTGRGDFTMDDSGHLQRRGETATAPFSYASALVTTAVFYDNTPDGPFSNNLLFDRAIERQRLIGQRLDGTWMHIGTPASLADAERAHFAHLG